MDAKQLLLLPPLLLLLLANAVSTASVCIDSPKLDDSGILEFPVDNLTSSLLKCFQDSRYCSQTKFSICMTLQPSVLNDNQCNTVFSTGGETPYTYGFYLLREADRKFKFGVSGKDSSMISVKWEIEFEISKTHMPVKICGTWEDRSGLNLYIDNMKAIVKQDGEAKVMQTYFIDMGIPYQETMQFCPDKKNLKAANSGISDICVEETLWDSDDFTGSVLPYADFNCTNSVPPSLVVQNKLLTSENRRVECFTTCSYFRPTTMSVLMKQVHTVHSNGSCFCIKQIEHLEGVNRISCSEASDPFYHVYLTSQLYLNPTVNMYFNVTAVGLYSDTMYTGEAVGFTVKIYTYSEAKSAALMSSAEDFTIDIDFGDGRRTELQQTEFSHTYVVEGQKTVKVKVKTNHGEATKTLSLTLENKETSKSVSIDSAKVFAAQHGEHFAIAFTSVVAGQLEKTMRLSVNDELKDTWTSTDYSNTKTGSIAVPTIGIYTLKLHVTNRRVESTSTATIVIGDSSNHVISAVRGESVTIEFPNANQLSPSIEVFSSPDNTKLDFTATNNAIVIAGATLVNLGHTQVQLRIYHSSGKLVMSKRLQLHSCPKLISVLPEKRSGLKDDTFPVDFVIGGFGNFELRICDGKNLCEFAKIDGLNGNVTIHRDYVYNVMGVFFVSLRVGNELCSKEEKVMIGTQVPIRDAKVEVTVPLTVREKLKLDLYINQEFGLAIGGESNVAKVKLGSESEKSYTIVGNLKNFGPFPLEYDVTTYGTFQLSITLSNDIGSLTITQEVNIGKQINGISTQVLQSVSGLENHAQIAVTVGSGYPIQLKLTSGNWYNTIESFNPHDYNEGSQVFLFRANISKACPTRSMTLQVKDSDASIKNMELTGYIVITSSGRTLTLHLLGQNFQLGENSVTVSVFNPFTNPISEQLCSPIFYSTEASSCSHITNIYQQSNKLETDQTITIEKSATLALTAKSTMGNPCSGVFQYHWEVLKVIDTLHSVNNVTNLQPLRHDCSVKSAKTFTLMKHSLPYGVYRICLLALPPNKQLSADSRVCLTVKIVRSDLVCSFAGDKSRGVNLDAELDVDFSNCYDPDDTHGTNTLTFVGTCISLEYPTVYSETDCCKLTPDTSWNLLPLPATSANASNVTFYDYKGSCIVDPTELTYQDYKRTFIAKADNLNSAQLLQFCICAFDTMGRTKSDTMEAKVVVINNMEDAKETLGQLDTSNPTTALAVINIITSAVQTSNDTAQASQVKDEACNKMVEISNYLEKSKQVVSFTGTLATLTTGDSTTETAQSSSANALATTSKKLQGMADATADEVTSATNGSAAVVGNTQPTQTPSQQTTSTCLNNLASLGFDAYPHLCNSSTEDEVTTARRRRSIQEDPLELGWRSRSRRSDETDVGDDEASDNNNNVNNNNNNEDNSNSSSLSTDKLVSDVCKLPAGYTIDGREFFVSKSCEEITEMVLYMDPEERAEYLDGLIQAIKEKEEALTYKYGNVTSQFLGALTTQGGTSLAKGSNSSVENDAVAVKTVKPTVTNTSGGAVNTESKTGGVSLPTSGISDGNGVAMQTYAQNPICHGDQPMSSGMASITVNDAAGNVVDTNDLSEPISVYLKRPAAKSNCVLYPIKHDNKIGNCHCVNLTKPNRTISVYVRDLGNDTSMTDIVFRVYFFKSMCPDLSVNNYTWNGTLPRTDEEIKANLTESELERLEGSDGLELMNELRNTLPIPQELTNEADYYCVFVTLSTATVQFDKTAAALQPNIVYQYCSVIDFPAFFNETTRKWEPVQRGPLNCASLSHMKTTHLTSFASDMIVPPNTIDFNTVWSKFKNLSENAAVFATVISILILYILLSIWARYKDKQDIKKWGATHLQDNLPTDTYMYQVSVMTGYRKGSGTRSKVYFILCGDNGDTGVRELNDGDRKSFPRGTVYNYVMSTDSCLGPLTFLRIWHDNSGKGQNKSWYLDQIVVNDLQTGDKFFFLCNNWLAVEEGDGMVERILPVSGLADLVAFKQLFSSSVQRKLRNEHLWFSIFSRPTRSTFTRVQRISCCLSLLFLTMITNAMFFKAEDNMAKRTGITVGPITFTLDQLFISVVSTLIVFPPSIIIVTFFKKCKAKSIGNRVVQENQDLSTKSNKYTWRKVHDSQLFNIAEDGTESGGWGNGESSMQKKNNRIWENLKNLVSFQSTKEVTVDDPELKNKKKPFLFPHWCIYIAWVLVFFSVFGSAFFVILYSMEWGRDKSNDWLLTFVLSFVQNVIVVQPVKVLVLAAVISMIIKKPEAEDEEAAFDEAMIQHDQQQQMVQKKDVDIQHIMLQRRSPREDLCVPNQEKLAEIREIRLKELKMESIIKEMMAYTVFVLVVFFISYQTRSPNSFKLSTVIKNTFTNKFDQSVPTYKAFYKYVNETLIPNMYAGDFENGNRATWRDKLAINDGSRNIIRVGVPRLRQFRVKDNTCKTHKDFSRIIVKPCRASYGWLDDDTKPYEPFWVPMDEEKWKTEKKNKTYSSAFVYSSSVKLKGLPYMAQVQTYKGGGYVLNFARNKEKTQKKINEIFELNWLDTRTRAVFIEFTVYNAPSNLFASVVMVAEFLETGGSTTYTEVKVFRLFSYVGSFGAIVMFMEIVFALFVLYFSIREGLQIKQLGCKYFNGFWNILEFTTLCITITAVVMYIFKKILASVAMSSLSSSTSSDFVNFGSVATYDEMYAYMVGIVVFISTIKFIKILRFNKRMGMLGSTIKMATKDLRSFMIMFLVYFMAFCHSAYLIFGRHLVSYGSFIGTWEALFSMALGSFNFHELQQVNGLLGPMFFFSFICLVTFGLLGIFLTIINDSFAVVKANADLQSNDYELVEFMTKRVKQLLGCSMGGDNAKDAEDAEDEEQNGSAVDVAAASSSSLKQLKF